MFKWEGFSWILFSLLMGSGDTFPSFPSGSESLYPFLRIPGDRCPGDIQVIPSNSGVHPVIGLQVADDFFQTGPSGAQPLEPGGLFVRPLGLSLAVNRHLGNLLQMLRLPFLLALLVPWSAASLFGRDPVAFTQSSSASTMVVESCRLSGYQLEK